MNNIKYVPNFNDYYINDNGEVFSMKSGVATSIALRKGSKGYIYVEIWNNNQRKHLKVHRLVDELFIPNPYNKPCVNHVDGNKNNNNIKNLEWVTDLENHKHAVVNKLHAHGESLWTAKLSNENILFIRTHYKPYDKKYGGIQLSKLFNVSPQHINLIIKNKIWKHI